MAASPELPQRVRDTAVALMRWLRASRVDGAVIGGVAVSLLAEPRFTNDVDAVVWAADARWAPFLAEGRRFGFVPRIADALDFARQNRVRRWVREFADVLDSPEMQEDLERLIRRWESRR